MTLATFSIYSAAISAFAKERCTDPAWIQASCKRSKQKLKGADGRVSEYDGWLIGGDSAIPQFKPDTPPLDEKGKPRKYSTLPGTKSNVFKPVVPQYHPDPYKDSTDAIITEGHLKAIKGASVGLPVYSVPGVDNLCPKGELNPGMRELVAQGKRIILAYDADAATNPNVHRATIKSAKTIIAAGGECLIATGQWQQSEGKGMDDFITNNGVDEMKARLEKALTLDQYIERFDVNKKSSNEKVNPGAIASTLAKALSERIAFNIGNNTWLEYGRNIPGVWSEVHDKVVQSLIKQEIEKTFPSVESADIRLIKVVAETMSLDMLWQREHTWSDGIPFLNGVLRGNEPVTHSPTNRLMWCLPRNYEPSDNDWSVIKEFMLNLVGGNQRDLDTLNAFAAALIQGTRSLQKYLHLIGAAGSGKDTFATLLQKLVGMENVKVSSIPLFCQDKFEAVGAYGKRLLYFGDEDPYHGKDIKQFKNATGEGQVRGEDKGKSAFSFWFDGLVLVTSNDPVFSPAAMKAMFRRQVLVECNNPPLQQDPDLPRKLDAQLTAWTNYLLTWTEAQIREALTTKTSRGNLLDWETYCKTDSLAAWIDDHLIFHSESLGVPVGSDKNEIKTVGDIYQCDTLFGSYSAYCEQTHSMAKSHRTFRTDLINLLERVLRWGTEAELYKKGNAGRKIYKIRLRRSDDIAPRVSETLFSESDGYGDGSVTDMVTVPNPCHTSKVTVVTDKCGYSSTYTSNNVVEGDSLLNSSFRVESDSKPSQPSLSFQDKVSEPSLNRHRTVTEPSPMTISVDGRVWEIFEPRPGDRVEFVTTKGDFSSGDRATVQRVDKENIYFTVDTITLAGKKGQKESAATKFDVRLVGRD